MIIVWSIWFGYKIQQASTTKGYDKVWDGQEYVELGDLSALLHKPPWM